MNMMGLMSGAWGVVSDIGADSEMTRRALDTCSV